MVEENQKLETLFNNFKKKPSITVLDEIIQLAKEDILKIKNTNEGFSLEMAKSYYNWWIRADPTPGYTNQHTISEHFVQILRDISLLLKSGCTIEVQKLYLDLLISYNYKIMKVYQRDTTVAQST